MQIMLSRLAVAWVEQIVAVHSRNILGRTVNKYSIQPHESHTHIHFSFKYAMLLLVVISTVEISRVG
jgi:hypothetical protein